MKTTTNNKIESVKAENKELQILLPVLESKLYALEKSIIQVKIKLKALQI